MLFFSGEKRKGEENFSAIALNIKKQQCSVYSISFSSSQLCVINGKCTEMPRSNQFHTFFI